MPGLTLPSPATLQVASPFQAILDFDLSRGIPPGWINYSLSKSAPTGFWHRAERGEIAVDGAFFDGFHRDLHNPALWYAFYARERAKDPPLSLGLRPCLP